MWSGGMDRAVAGGEDGILWRVCAWPCGGIGRHEGLKIPYRKVCGFESHRGYLLLLQGISGIVSASVTFLWSFVVRQYHNGLHPCYLLTWLIFRGQNA